MEEERRQSQAVMANSVKNLVKSVDEMKQDNADEHKMIINRLDKLNGSVAKNKEWIDCKKTDIENIIDDRKNFIRNMFNVVWKTLAATVAVVFGINYLR